MKPDWKLKSSCAMPGSFDILIKRGMEAVNCKYALLGSLKYDAWLAVKITTT
jgi:hypothetical protein